jgi:uncharacterized protein
MSEDARPHRTVTVSATGSVAADPDLARINMGVVTEADTARAALDANTAALKAAIAGLKAEGIDARDIQTSQFQIDPRHQHFNDGRPALMNGYTVTNQVQLVVRKLASLGQVLDRMVTLGANQVHGIQFDVSTAETLKDDARRTAMTNALRRAKLYATALGAEVGDVLTIAEEPPHAQVRPMMMIARAASHDSVPVEPGQQMLEARVHVTWALK